MGRAEAVLHSKIRALRHRAALALSRLTWAAFCSYREHVDAHPSDLSVFTCMPQYYLLVARPPSVPISGISSSRTRSRPGEALPYAGGNVRGSEFDMGGCDLEGAHENDRWK